MLIWLDNYDGFRCVGGSQVVIRQILICVNGQINYGLHVQYMYVCMS